MANGFLNRNTDRASTLAHERKLPPVRNRKNLRNILGRKKKCGMHETSDNKYIGNSLSDISLKIIALPISGIGMNVKITICNQF
jgi:hypothetical protein